MALAELLSSIITQSFQMINSLGYIVVFAFGVLSSLEFFIPFPQGIIIFTLGSVFNPVLLAFTYVLGSMVGVSIKYILGLGGKELLEKKYSKEINKTKRMFEKHGPFLWIFIASLTPIPDDIISIFCGIIKYDFKKYFLATFLGRFLLNLLVAVAGHYSVFWLLKFLGITM